MKTKEVLEAIQAGCNQLGVGCIEVVEKRKHLQIYARGFVICTISKGKKQNGDPRILANTIRDARRNIREKLGVTP